MSKSYILPTIYNGVKYRSRTEARWALFFDVAGIKFAYEQEAFSLKSGNYLPDFTIFSYNSGENVFYAEVKGSTFSSAEKTKCKHLCEATNSDVVMLDGPPDFKCYNVFTWNSVKDCKATESCLYFETPSCLCGNKKQIQEIPAILCTAQCKYFPFFWQPGFEDNKGYFKPDDWYIDHKNAILEAQNERFGIYANTGGYYLN